MHNGEIATLSDVVDFYDRGGDFDAPNKNPLIVPFNLSPQEKAALLAFMTRPLTDPRAAAESAPFDRPRLYTESARASPIEGTGIPVAAASSRRSSRSNRRSPAVPAARSASGLRSAARPRYWRSTTAIRASRRPPAAAFAREEVTLSAPGPPAAGAR